MTWQSRIKYKKKYMEKALGNHITDYASDVSTTDNERKEGITAVEGPYPRHTWYARVELDEKGVVRKIS